MARNSNSEGQRAWQCNSLGNNEDYKKNTEGMLRMLMESSQWAVVKQKMPRQDA
jgi:hypothetical protein